MWWLVLTLIVIAIVCFNAPLWLLWIAAIPFILIGLFIIFLFLQLSFEWFYNKCKD
jgi:hypothetical protein